MLTCISDNDYILITTAAYEEVVEQLEEIAELKYIKFSIYSVARIEQYDCDRMNIKVPSCLSVYQKNHIPKVIHYCWFGKNQFSDQNKKWMESWKKYCPDYEIVEWNEDNYDVHKNRFMSQAYDAKQWAFVSDYARIDIINEYGGVYLDTDVELLKNIDVLLQNNGFCGFESNEYINYGLGFGAKKHNLMLSEIKEHYDSIDFVLGNGTFNRTPCPVIQTEIMKRHGLKCNGEFQVIDGMAVYPSRVLCGMSPHSFRIERDLRYSYAIHHFSGSWVEDKYYKKDMITCLKKWGKNDEYNFELKDE